METLCFCFTSFCAKYMEFEYVKESYFSEEYHFVEIDENFNIITTPEPGGGVPDGGFPDGEWPQPSGSSDSEGCDPVADFCNIAVLLNADYH